MRSSFVALAALASAITALPVSAHHSASGYDMKKTLTAQATIKEFRWGAPHSGAVFIVAGPKGEKQEVRTSSASPAVFIRSGFNPKDFKVGQKVEIKWHPTRKGTLGGILSSIKFPDGREFTDQEFATQIEGIEAAERAKAKP